VKKWLAMLAALLLFPACAGAQATLFSVNVGKADAHLLHYGDTLYLIDAGTAASYGQLSCALKTLGVIHLDGVIVTHTDKDHVGGLMALATSSIEIDAWYASAFFTGVKEKKHPAVLAAKVRGQSVKWLQSGDSLPLGDGTLQVLGPIEASEEENDNSLILLADTPDGRMLLMGDAELSAESRLLTKHKLPRCEVLKVGHHGADDATSDLLLATVQPKVAVISTSTAEREETPGMGTLRDLLKIGAEIAVTQDASGGVLVTLAEGRAEAVMASWPEFPAKVSGLRFTDKDNKEETLRLHNDSAVDIDLTGCFIRSAQGNEAFTLPEGTVIGAGASLLITTQTSDVKGDILWPEEKVWDNQAADAAILCDVYGRILATME